MTKRKLHDWTNPRGRHGKCRKCGLVRRTVVGPAAGRKTVYTTDWETFTAKMPGCQPAAAHTNSLVGPSNCSCLEAQAVRCRICKAKPGDPCSWRVSPYSAEHCHAFRVKDYKKVKK